MGYYAEAKNKKEPEKLGRQRVKEINAHFRKIKNPYRIGFVKVELNPHLGEWFIFTKVIAFR